MAIGTSLGQGIALGGVLPAQDTSFLEEGIRYERGLQQKAKEDREKKRLADEEKYNEWKDKISVSGKLGYLTDRFIPKAGTLIDNAAKWRSENPNSSIGNSADLRKQQQQYALESAQAEEANRLLAAAVDFVSKQPKGSVILNPQLAEIVDDPRRAAEILEKAQGGDYIYRGNLFSTPAAAPKIEKQFDPYAHAKVMADALKADLNSTEKGATTTKSKIVAEQKIKNAKARIDTDPVAQQSISLIMETGKVSKEEARKQFEQAIDDGIGTEWASSEDENGGGLTLNFGGGGGGKVSNDQFDFTYQETKKVIPASGAYGGTAGIDIKPQSEVIQPTFKITPKKGGRNAVAAFIDENGDRIDLSAETVFLDNGSWYIGGKEEESIIKGGKVVKKLKDKIIPYDNNEAYFEGQYKNSLDDIFNLWKSGSGKVQTSESGGKQPSIKAGESVNKGAKKNIPLISTKAEFDALPKGAKYTKADGKTYTKG
jgi:hypothetical protein